VYTGQCPVLQGTAASGTRQPREFTAAAPLKFTGLSGEPRSNDYLGANGYLQAHSMRARGAQTSGTPILAHRTWNSTCPVCTGHPGGPRSQKLQRSESNGIGDVAGAPDMSGAPSNRQPPPTVKFGGWGYKYPNHPHIEASKFSTSQPLTRARHSILDTPKRSNPLQFHTRL
jgi:hypothetical protein